MFILGMSVLEYSFVKKKSNQKPITLKIKAMIKKMFLVNISFQPDFPVSIFRVNTISTMDKFCM